jgi:GxxExxY protein
MKVPPYFKQSTDTIVELAKKVQKNLGNCFTKAIYADALEREFIENAVRFKRNVSLDVYYGANPLPLAHQLRVDFIVDCKVLVMLKTGDGISNTEEADIISMLQAAKKTFAILLQYKNNHLTINKFVRYKKYKNTINSNPEDETNAIWSEEYSEEQLEISNEQLAIRNEQLAMSNEESEERSEDVITQPPSLSRSAASPDTSLSYITPNRVKADNGNNTMLPLPYPSSLFPYPSSLLRVLC